MNDMVSRFFVAGIQMGALPNIPVKVHITPVDYVSGAIAHLSLKKESLGHAFHLVNKNIKTIIESTEIINSLGYNVEADSI